MLNSITIMGRLCADPELKTTQSGISVCLVNVAVDRDYAPNGEKQTDFISVVCWRQTAEMVSRYFNKGKMIAIQGSLQSRKWQDRDGNSRVTWEIQANHVWFCGDKSAEREDTAPRDDSYAPQAQTPQAAATEDFAPLPDDDLPF